MIFLEIGVRALGIRPIGNVLSAIVWIQRRANSSAINLAAVAINDSAFLLIVLIPFAHLALQIACAMFYMLEPFLVLSFSVERLYAICRPLHV